MGFSRKNQKRRGGGGGGGDSFFENPHGLFFIFLLNPWKFQTKQSSTLGNFTKLCYIPLKLQGQKQRPLEILHYSFLVTLGNSTLFLINPWKFYMLFLWYPWKFHILIKLKYLKHCCYNVVSSPALMSVSQKVKRWGCLPGLPDGCLTVVEKIPVVDRYANAGH